MPSPTESPNLNRTPPPGAEVHVPLHVKAFSSALFSGYSPVASGTVGSAVGLAIYFIPGFEQPYSIIPFSFAAFVLGIKGAGIMENRYGHDPAEVTIDEVLGMWISLFLLPKSLAIGIVAFLIFRILDIFKPWPAKKFDKIRGGFGIMMDDVVSGFYTNVIMHILVRFGLADLLSF